MYVAGTVIHYVMLCIKVVVELRYAYVKFYHEGRKMQAESDDDIICILGKLHFIRNIRK